MNNVKFTSEIYAHSDHLMSHALKFTRDEDDAKDLLQETLIKGLRFAHSFDQGTNLRGWLYVIMRNTYINDYRKDTKRKAFVTVEEEITNGQLAISATKNAGESTFALEDINKAMASIKDEYRIPFKKYFEGYKYDEIAAELNLPIGTVKTHIHQARQGLKKYLKMYRS
ncbi:MAG: sigma-70 family RNA polymerase sigma factor [Chryseobacterium sp.]|uniref:Sigma-70 family RNA polymerase sigma factor n=1 Tax=Pedobacter agri TaxID=454586 RepID=A0A9X3IB14_9SPHI|nr:sigma-70 family RNA polymerase sigma factor [Pedobacter agri]MCX3267507.1 sigma-70 family RNA polymerase sigma factor [Pedobacter agri]MDQ1142773.1 RNA polymerase sigma factor (sigma-70 family) [Pedobacter agri]RZJ89206.1 MAG: sigma-70 family RNA polymerase sigma factor [Chryseobacterium sp.]